MGRLTFDISASEHQQLKVLAAKNGTSMKDFVLSRLLPELADSNNGNGLRQKMDDFEMMRKNFRLERGGTPWRDLAHEGHKW